MFLKYPTTCHQYLPLNKQDFNRVYIEHRGGDGVNIDAIHIYWTDGSCTQCGRQDNNNRAIGFLDDNDYRDLTCTQTCT